MNRINGNDGAVKKEQLRAEVRTWAERIGVEPKELHIRPMNRKWGSCSAGGRVTFNSELMAESDEFRKRVIVHELVHLKVPNHGKLFRALLRAHLGTVENPPPSRS